MKSAFLVPQYFALMEKLNLKGGVPIARPPNEVPVLQPKKFASQMGEGLVIDARDPEAFASGHIPKSYSIWAAGLSVFGGWIAGPNTPVHLVLTSIEQLEDAVLSLARIGVDNVAGVLAGGFDKWRDAGLPIERSGAITPRELEAIRRKVRVLDVREDNEFEDEGHIAAASHLYVGYLEKHLTRVAPPIDKSDRVVVTCSVGHRASLATSILRRNGFENVENLLGGMTAWEKLELPLERGNEHTVTTTDVEGERS